MVKRCSRRPLKVNIIILHTVALLLSAKYSRKEKDFALACILFVSDHHSKVSVVKAVTAKTGSVFPPLKPLHTEAQISSEELEKQWKAKKGRWRASRYISMKKPGPGLG